MIMLAQLRPAVTFTAMFILLTGIAYPLAVTAIAQIAFQYQADGSLLRDGDTVIGSAVVGQAFSSDRYFWPRPSAAGAGYDAAASSGSNLGPTSAKLAERVLADVERLRKNGFAGVIPADAATASASGLDPHISPEFARRQIERVARSRQIGEPDVAALVDRFTEGRLLSMIGEPRVNVLLINRALDAPETGR